MAPSKKEKSAAGTNGRVAGFELLLELTRGENWCVEKTDSISEIKVRCGRSDYVDDKLGRSWFKSWIVEGTIWAYNIPLEQVSMEVPVEFVKHVFEVEDQSGPGMRRGQAGKGTI